MTEEAVAFIKKHNLQQVLTSAVNVVLKKKNEDPFRVLSKEMKPPLADVVFVLGGPGAGKGTQCARIVDEFGRVHLSAGDLLRAERKNVNSEHGQLINDIIKEGKIVPVEITVGLIKVAMEASMMKGSTKFLVDGFPRNQDNVDGWTKVMTGFANVEFVLYLTCSEDTMRQRLITRGETSGRSDDNEAAIVKRFRTFHESSKPIIEMYQTQNKVREIASEASVDEVYAEVKKIFLPTSIEPNEDERLASIAYLEKHNIKKVLNSALNVLLKQLPVDDPFPILAENFKKYWVPNPRVVFVLGGPGSGKGTQCARLVDEFGWVHLSAGDLLRAERKNPESEHGKTINDIIAEGKIVPVEITVNLIKIAMEKNIFEGSMSFLIDGFPRNQDNVRGWAEIMSDFAEVLFMLYLTCSEEAMTARIMSRAKESGRVDDNADAIIKRLRTYHESTMPIIEQYRERGKVREISSDPSIEEVYAEVRKVFVDLS